MNFGSSSPLGNALSYPKARPQYDLNLIRNKFIPPEYTFTRNSPGTYVGADGYIKTAAANEPRFDYDPITGEFKGLLVEEQLTNIFRNHSTFSGQSCAASTSNLNWTQNSISVSTNQTIAPDGTLSAARLTPNANNGYLASNAAGYPTAFGVDVGTQRCLSIFAKAGSVSGAYFQQGGGSDYGYTFNIGTNDPEQIFQFGYSIKYPNGWFRLVLSRYAFNGGALLIRPSPSTAGSSIFIWGPQGEIAERASSYISAPGNSNVTRQPDQLILNKPFNSLGTFFVEATPTTGTVLSADNGTSGLVMSSTGKEALYYNTNRTLRMPSDSIPALFNSSAPQDLNRVSLGHNALYNSSYINGYLKKFMYYGSPVTEDNLRSLTGNILDTYRHNNDGIVTNGLVLHLDAGNPESYLGSGTTWTDLSGNGNNGTLNGPTYSSANGGSLSFDGSNDLMNLNSSLNLSTNSGFTMCLFLQQNITQSNSTWNYFHSKNSPQIEIGAYGTSATSFIFKDNSTNSSVSSNNIVSSWSYIVFGTNPTTRTPFIQTFNSSGNFLSTSPTAFSNTTIGFERLFSTGTGGGPAGTQYYGAKCAIIQAYNRVLTPQEIQQNFNALRGRFGI